MHKIFKKGMTLGELCIVFAIMGVVASMTLIASKPYDKSIKYAYEKVYNTLNTAFYNAQLDLPTELRTDEAQYNEAEDKCENGDNSLCVDGTFPMNSYTLCYMLTQYINTSQNTVGANCSADTLNIYKNNSSKGKDLKTISNVDRNFANTTPHIIASNGVRYWIISFKNTDLNKPLEADFRQNVIENSDSGVTYSNTGESALLKLYYIAADINGSMGPNTARNSEKRIADIVLFAALSTGDIVPLGMPVHDKRYITAEVVGPNGRPIPGLPPLSIFQAKRLAWGYKKIDGHSVAQEFVFNSADNPLSLQFGGRGCVEAGTGGTGRCMPDANNPFFVSMDKYNDDTFTRDLTYNDACRVSGNDPTLDPTACYIKLKDYY